jgi:hypothetical protein
VSGAFKQANGKCIGKVTLQVHFSDEEGKVLTFPHKFYVVSQLQQPIFIGSELISNDLFVLYSTPEFCMMKYPDSPTEDTIKIKFKYYSKESPKPTRLVTINTVEIEPGTSELVMLQAETDYYTLAWKIPLKLTKS